MANDLRASILAEAAEIAMHHPSKDAQAFACSVTDFLTSPVAPERVVAEHFIGYLCRAWGETEHPSAELVRDLNGVRRFMVREWLGEEDATDYDGTPTLPAIMEEIEGRDWRGEWHIEFEIGGVSVEQVFGTAIAASPEAAPAASTSEWMPPTVEQVEHELGMGHGAWDMEDPEGIIRAILRLATPPAATPAAPSAVTDEQIIDAADSCGLDIGPEVFAFARAVLALAQSAPVQAGAQQAVADVIDAFEAEWNGFHLDHGDVIEWVEKMRAALAAPTQAGREMRREMRDGWTVRTLRLHRRVPVSGVR